MSDLLDDFNKIFKKDFLPIFVKYFNDPNNKIADNLNDILNDPQTLLTNIFEKFANKTDNDSTQNKYTDCKNYTDIDPSVVEEYKELFKRLILIEENMIQLEKLLKDKN